jgi:3-methyladenine DNA glycosylase AlkD
MNPEIRSIVNELRASLALLEDPVRRAAQEPYFQGTIQSLGIPLPEVHAISRSYNRILRQWDREDIFDLCETLLSSGRFEESIIACHWSRLPQKQYRAADIKKFAQWIDRYVGNWATCDAFCNHTVGLLLMMFPSEIQQLMRWAQHKNRWMRRASAVSLIVPGGRGFFVHEIEQIAVLLLEDGDDMVQKGYGWMLKVTYKSHPKRMEAFVRKYGNRMPRTALRYAIEKWPEEKRKAMLHQTRA